MRKKKFSTYYKYDPNTYPGRSHLSEQFDKPSGLSDEDMEGIKEALAQQESSMSDRDKKIRGIKMGSDEGVDTTPWEPELYNDSSDSNNPFDVK